MKKIILRTFVLSLLFVGLCTTSLFAKTQYSCDGKVTSYGELSCSSSKSNGWSHTSQYVFYGSNITCQVWIRDADYNERTKSATRAASNSSASTTISANILHSSIYHYHYYADYKNSV